MKIFKGMRENFPFTLERLYIPLYLASSFLSVSERIVVFLAQKLLRERRKILVDCWNVSTRPALFLLQSYTYITGTMRTNKEVLRHFMDEDLNKGSSIFIRNEDMLLVRLSAKKYVYILTTRYEASVSKKKRSLLVVSRTSIISLIILKDIIK